MKRAVLVFSFLALCFLPVQGIAQDHSAHGGKPAASPPPSAATASGGHAVMHGNSLMLEEVTEAGVRAMVHLNDVEEAMAKMGRKENFHLMVMFTEVASGKAVSEGSSALRITGPGEEKPGPPIALVPMAGQFGADISLSAKGPYTFEIGSKLADGVKRQFKFRYTKP